uniref:Uncharacterized protein n=1 Tax=Anguilla anguilla TaxID=7936 RepID=A0A0E9WI02_ANGAN
MYANWKNNLEAHLLIGMQLCAPKHLNL